MKNLYTLILLLIVAVSVKAQTTEEKDAMHAKQQREAAQVKPPVEDRSKFWAEIAYYYKINTPQDAQSAVQAIFEIKKMPIVRDARYTEDKNTIEVLLLSHNKKETEIVETKKKIEKEIIKNGLAILETQQGVVRVEK